MKTRVPLFLLLVAFLVAFAAPRARAQDEVSFDYFYDNLKPYGEWVQVADYGLCWHPNEADDDWAPYTDGYWSYTDAGWTWVSYEDFGDIVYHYGRWVRVEGEGWCWVPDHQWGPAWVSWRNNDEYVGWAPLPPEARFEAATGISTWVDDTYDIGPGYYRFCRVRDFGAPVLREVCFPRSRSIEFYGDTVNITNITFNTGFGVPFCGGPRYDFISARVARPIPALKLVRETNITNINIGGGNRQRAFASVQRGNTLIMPAPRMRPIVNRNAPIANLAPAKVLTAEHVNRGWSDVKTPQERERLREVVKQQTKGATPASMPARAFSQAEVKSVPLQADPNAGSLHNRVPGKGPSGVASQPRPATVEEPRKETQPVTKPGFGKGTQPQAPIVTKPEAPREIRPEEPRTIPGSNVPVQPFRRNAETGAPSTGPKSAVVNPPLNPEHSAPKTQKAEFERQQKEAKAEAAAQQQQKLEMQREQSAIRHQPPQVETEHVPMTKQRQGGNDGGASAARQQQQAAAAARERSQQAAAASAARERAAQNELPHQVQPPRQAPGAPQRQFQPPQPGQGAPGSSPVPAKGKGKDKDDDKR